MLDPLIQNFCCLAELSSEIKCFGTGGKRQYCVVASSMFCIAFVQNIKQDRGNNSLLWTIAQKTSQNYSSVLHLAENLECLIEKLRNWPCTKINTICKQASLQSLGNLSKFQLKIEQ